MPNSDQLVPETELDQTNSPVQLIQEMKIEPSHPVMPIETCTLAFHGAFPVLGDGGRTARATFRRRLVEHERPGGLWTRPLATPGYERAVHRGFIACVGPRVDPGLDESRALHGEAIGQGRFRFFLGEQKIRPVDAIKADRQPA